MDSRIRFNYTPDLRYAGLLLCAMVVSLSCTGAAQADASSKLSGRSVEQLLRDRRDLILKDKTIVGPLTITAGRSLRARRVTFEGSLQIAGELPRAKFEFVNTRFKGPVDLYLSQVDSFDCDLCEFRDDVTFHSLVAKSLWLLRTTLKGYSVFAAMRVSDLNLADAHFEKTADFSGAKLDAFNAPRLRADQPVLITWDQFGDSWAEDEREWATAPYTEDERQSRIAQVEGQLRFWKNNFTELDQQLDAREANFQLIKLKRSETFTPLSMDYWAARVLEIGSRYGTRPYQPFLIGLGVILCFTLFFLFATFKEDNDAQQPLPRPWKLPFAFAFSIQTFIPFLTLPGIKDRWKITRLRWLEPLEGVLGVILFGLVAYSLSYLL